jgi:hypothetical protein
MTSVGATQSMSSLLGGADSIPESARAIPSGVNYVAVPPLGKRASATMRRFRPTTGSTYSPAYNVVRIPLNSTGFMDMQHSYLDLEVECRCAVVADQTLTSTVIGEGPTTFSATMNSNSGFLQHNALFALDGGAHALISRIRIEGSDGNELERIDNVNILANLLADIHLPKDYTDSYGNVQEGMDISNNALHGSGERGPVTVGRLAPSFNTAPSGSGGRLRFCFAPLSGILQSKKYLPLFAVRGGGIILEITFETADRAWRAIPVVGAANPPNSPANAAEFVPSITLTSGASTQALANQYAQAVYNAVVDLSGVQRVRYEMDYQVNKVEYVAKVIDFTEDFNQQFVSMLRENGGLQIPTCTYYTHPQTLRGVSEGQSTQVFSIAERAHSLKALLAAPMLPTPKTQIDRALQKTISARPFPLIRQWQFRVGAISYPQQPVVNVDNVVSDQLAQSWVAVAGAPAKMRVGYEAGASFNEMLKAFNRIFDIHSGGRIDASQYTSPGHAARFQTTSSDVLVPAGARIPVFAVDNALNTVSGGQLLYTDVGSKFAYALDFESFAQDNDVLASGLDTASTALPIDLELHYGPTGGSGLAGLMSVSQQSVAATAAAAGGANVNFGVPTAGDRPMFIYAMVDLILTLDSEGFLYSAK